MNGLTSSEVLESRKKYGANKIPEKPLKKWNEFFFETFKDGLNLILLGMMVAFCILAVTGNGSFSEPAGVGVVLIAIAIISTNTGLKSQKATKELRDKTSVHYCNVIRDGQPQHINTDELVVGDLVIIQAGEGIYADGYLVEGHLAHQRFETLRESPFCYIGLCHTLSVHTSKDDHFFSNIIIVAKNRDKTSIFPPFPRKGGEIRGGKRVTNRSQFCNKLT